MDDCRRVLWLVRGVLGPSATRIAAAAGLDYAAPNRISRWLAGETTPRCADLLALLDTAGLLQPEAVAAWRAVSLPEAALVVAERRREHHDRYAAALSDAVGMGR